MSVAHVLGRSLDQIWPQRRRQEALLDLGENKGWGADDRVAALKAVAAWLVDQEVLPADGPAVPAVPRMELETQRRWAAAGLPARDEVAGVADDLVRLAPMVGTTPKTLANTLSRGWRADRADHRWLLALARAPSAPPSPDLLFHRRSRAAVQRLWVRLAGHVAAGQPDAADALFVFSLLVLWQRRRPPEAARANRGQVRRRSETPLPLVVLTDTLITPGAFRALVEAASPAVLVVALEAGFTVAHVEPRRARGVSEVPPTRWPVQLRATLERVAHRLPDEVDHLHHRLAIMEVWGLRARWPEPPAAIADHPYVRFGAVLAAMSRGVALDADVKAAMLAGDWEGRPMLAPWMKRRLGE